ncbi:MAG: tetratricopeptide repeat protein [Rhodocyclales bacterium]|nr:tetratricopeptide repeat protein [Rhodocyclales bacterium]
MAPTANRELQEAVAHHRQGRLKQAERLYRSVLRAAPGDAVANHNLGDLLLRKEKVIAALPHLLAALEADPTHGQYWISYIDALIRAGRLDEARDTLDVGRRHGLDGGDIDALALRLAGPAEIVARRDKQVTGDQPPAEEVRTMARLFAAGSFAEVVIRARAMTQGFPAHAFGWKVLGAALKNMGRHGEALQSMREAVALAPGDAEAHNNLGAVLHDQGRPEEAEASYRRALEISPTLADAHFNRGVTLEALQRPDDALHSYRAALAIRPGYADAWNNLGMLLRTRGCREEAEAAFRSALGIEPKFTAALGNLGVTLHELGRLEDAEDCYRRLLAIDPALAAVHSNLGSILHNLGRAEEAAACYRHALGLSPGLAEAHHDLGNTLKSLGRLDEAAESFREAHRLGMGDSRVKAELILPAIMGTRQEVLESRARFERNLEQLIADRVAIADPLRNIGETSFYLAYQGLNDRDLQVRLAQFYGQACPSLLHVAAHCAKPAPRSGKRVRIGFLSKFLYRHSVSLCFSRIIESLSMDQGFEVSLISSETVDAALYPGFAGRTLRIQYDLEQARRSIAALELDVLVYLDIGMEPLSYFLAFSRLAREQCVLGGHPVTTGIANVDHFVSVASMEPADADDHYSERLIRLPLPLAYFERPTVPARLRTRAELGLPEDRHIYMCPMKLQKIHPDFDEAISEILRLDDKGVVVLFEDDVHSYWKDALVGRFERTIEAELLQRILFLPWLKDTDAFFSAIAAADVVLDPFHFGLGSTAAVIAAAGTPLVTLAGAFMRGLVGAHYCRMLGAEECIATRPDEYVRIAVAIANDPQLRERLVTRVRDNCSFLYQSRDAAKVLADLLRSLAQAEAESTARCP